MPAFSQVGNLFGMVLARFGRPRNAGHTTRSRISTIASTVTNSPIPISCRNSPANCLIPDQWAKTFADSGTKYVVLTSKHHDGYCLWPSRESDKSWGRPWCSTNSGPGRDLLGELTTAVRKTDVKMGIYYSLYEWYNPLYTTDVSTFVDKHLIPQFKDVVTKYQPAVIFSDGEWDIRQLPGSPPKC